MRKRKLPRSRDTRQWIRATFACVVLSWGVVAGRHLVAQKVLSDFGEVKDPGQAYELLEGLAENAVSEDANLGRNRVSISDRVLTYDFRPASEDSLTSHPSRVTGSLELLIRVGALRRDFRQYLPTEGFWAPRLERVQNLSAEMLKSAYNTTSDGEWLAKLQDDEDQVAQEFAALDAGLVAYAQKSGLDVKSTKGIPQGYKVEIRIDPPKAHLKFMPLLDYRRCVAFKLDLKDYWVELNPGTHTLIGRYHYLAEWPLSLHGPDEDNFEITEEGMTLTFQPKGT